jgi:hypothetical protein
MVAEQEVMGLRYRSAVFFCRWLYGRRISPQAIDRMIIEFLENDICCVFDDGIDRLG